MAGSHPDKVFAQPPNEINAHGGLAKGDVMARIAKEGARTIPGRPEHGGNCDINNISRGSKTYLPVHVPGAKFSVGDLHFSQGDGEISFCGAIEMVSLLNLIITPSDIIGWHHHYQIRPYQGWSQVERSQESSVPTRRHGTYL